MNLYGDCSDHDRFLECLYICLRSYILILGELTLNLKNCLQCPQLSNINAFPTPVEQSPR
jgi:hypothetical protein